MELNKVQSRSIDIKYEKKSKQVPETEIEQFERTKAPSDPNYYKIYNKVSFKGHPYIDDVKSTERTKNVKLDDENFTVKSYKKDDKEYILTDSGTLYRLRYSKDKEKNAQTVLASKLYNLAGVKTPDMRVYESERGMNGYVSEYTDKLDSIESNPQALYDSFVVDAWLGNRNAYNHGNTGINKDGEVVKLVTSGSLDYRASGKRKDDFGKEVTELKTMRDPAKNLQSAKFLENMSDEDYKSSLQRVVDIKKNDIILAVNQSQIEDKQKMIDTLLARQAYIKDALEIKYDDKDSQRSLNNSEDLVVNDVEKVSSDVRARRREQLNKYLNGDYIYIDKDDPDDWFTKRQKEDIETVRQELETYPEKRELFEDILDISFWEYQGRRDLSYRMYLNKFVGFPKDKLEIISHLATFKRQGYIAPINEPSDYNKLNDISTDKLNYIVNKCDIITVDGILKMNEREFESIKYSMDLGEKYDIPKSLVNNIVYFASDDEGKIPKYKKDLMDTLLAKSDEFKKPYGSYYGGGPTCLLSSVLMVCDSEEKKDYILNTVLPKYEEVVPEYDEKSQYDIANLSKDGADFEFEMDKIKHFRSSNVGFEYDDFVNFHVKTREQLDIHKDCMDSGMSHYYAKQTLFHSSHYDSETDTTTYDYETIDFAKQMYKDNLQKIGIFNDYLIAYNWDTATRNEVVENVQKIKERGLTDLVIIDRMPPGNVSYLPGDRERHLLAEEVEILKDVPLEKFEKLKGFLNIPERKCQLPIDELVTLLDIDDKSNGKVEKFGLLNSEYNADQIMTLASMNESTLQEMENRGVSKSLFFDREAESYGEIAGYFDNFNKDDWDKAEERFFKNEKVCAKWNDMTFSQVKSLLELDNKTYNRIADENLFEKYGVQGTLQYIDFAEYENVSNINDLSVAQKRALLKKLIKYNRDLFGNDLNPPVVPKNQKEYCSTMNNLVNAIGLNTKPITDEVKAGYFDALDKLDDINGEFMNTDFTRVGAKLELKYSRDEFLSDVENQLSRLSEDDRSKVTNYFGFEYKEYSDGTRKMNGYPVDSKNDVDSSYNYQTRDAIDNLRPYIKRFSEHNEILPNATISPTLARELSKITKAFPELNTIIGKEQHQTHSYTVDIHSLNVLQNIMKNPRYRYLPENDKRALQTVALFHDLTKLEGAVDKTHPDYSAFDTYHLIKKLGLPEEKNLQIYQLIKNHDFNEKYSPLNAEDYAYELRQGNNFLMECIMSDADLRAVDRGETFYRRFGGKLKDAESTVSKLVEHIQETAICLPQTKIPKASELMVNGDTVQEKTSYDSEGNVIKNRVIYLKPNMNLKDIGFKDDMKVEDLNVLVHGLDNVEQSAIFNALGQIDSNALLSTSYVNYGKGNYHVFRQQGFVLDVAGDDIGAGYYRDFGSGYGKNLKALKEDYIFGNKMNEYRNYMSNCLKRELNLSDEEYKKLYPSISDKSITQLDKEYPVVAKAMRDIINNMEEGKRRNYRQYNEMLVARPKIQAVFYQGKKGKGDGLKAYEYNEIPTFLREYAAKNNVPIIYFGE